MQNEKVEWVKAKVVKSEQHYRLARKSTRGPPMRIAYEDVRLAPKGSLTQELLSCSLEQELQKHSVDGGVNTNGPLSNVRINNPATSNLMASEKNPKGSGDDIGFVGETQNLSRVY